MRRYSIALAAALALTAAGQATVQAAPKDQPNQCFRSSDIDSSTQATQTQLNIRLRDHRYLQIQTRGACFTTLGADPYILRFRGGSDLICHPIDIDLSAGPRGFQTPCFVDKIVPMTKEEVLALPKRQQP